MKSRFYITEKKQKALECKRWSYSNIIVNEKNTTFENDQLRNYITKVSKNIYLILP